MKKSLNSASITSWIVLSIAGLFWPLLATLGDEAAEQALGNQANWASAVLLGIFLNGIYLYAVYKEALEINAKRGSEERYRKN